MGSLRGTAAALIATAAVVATPACGGEPDPVPATHGDALPGDAPATASPCEIPTLAPARLPAGAGPVDEEPLVARPLRTKTWASDGVLVQLGEGFSADHGDEPGLRRVRVRGDAFANLLSHAAPDGRRLVSVDWLEQTPCGATQYVLTTAGLSEDETMAIARSLRVAER